MKKTGAWLVRHALESLGVTHTFGIPGVHNTEIYDELEKSESITPVLVTHEGNGAFMADAMSRTGSGIGTMVIVPAAGVTHAMSGIGEAYLDGIPMLVICGGIISDSAYSFQLHDINQHQLLKAITKATFKVLSHDEIVTTIYDAHRIAVSGEPGPVFVEIPVDVQINTGKISKKPFHESVEILPNSQTKEIEYASELLVNAQNPGIFVGWGAVDASEHTQAFAELLGAPVATTLQGLSAFPANHPLHTGMSFGAAAVPAATNAFKNCDCLLAVGTKFSEIATGSYSVPKPEKIIHIDINPEVFNKNYEATIAIEGDATEMMKCLLESVQKHPHAAPSDRKLEVEKHIATDKANFLEEWLNHDSGIRVNPAKFFSALRRQLPDDGIVVTDDGNHTFLTAELMPIHHPRHFISPTDFNCMGYAVPATIAAKLANPQKKVVSIIGDGAFLMTGMELMTANFLGIGAVFVIFNDGKLAQISQAQSLPYNRSTCTELADIRLKGIADGTGVEYIRMQSDKEIEHALEHAFTLADRGQSVILDVNIDYSKKTRFTQGIVNANFKRLRFNTKTRMIGRAVWRKVTSGKKRNAV